MTMKKLVIVAVLLIGVVIAYFVLNQGKEASTGESPEQITIDLSEYSESGQSGKATLTQEGSMLKVELELTGYESESPQPAHIHTGHCPRIGPVVHSLNDVIDGRSSTKIETTIEGLMASQDELNINVHASYDDFSTYTSCGDIK